ncbi:MAG: Ig-like domain repeat protein [Methanobacteriaceae archaeon]|nr:Ig-like domain repeat protein [Methanobacteriaceae archaeon]
MYTGLNNLTITNTSFINSSASGNGGNIYLRMLDNVIIINSSFENNFASGNGGNIFVEGLGQSNYYNLKVINSTFKNNTSPNGGGCMNLGSLGILEVTNSSFENNRANNLGGCIYVRQNILSNIYNCNFTNNYANEGSALYLYTTNVTNCNFINNIGNGSGVIKLYHNYTANIFNCNFTNNTGERGAGIHVFRPGSDVTDNPLVVINCTFRNNYAGSYGGAIYGASNTTLINVTFINNHSNGAAGAFNLAIYSLVNVTNCTFLGNYVNGTKIPYTLTGGGAIGADTGSILNVYNSEFKDNYCLTNNTSFAFDGGAITVAANSKVNVYDCNFTNNCANSTNGGGSIFVGAGGSFYGLNSSFNNGSVSKNGGALFINGITTIIDCNFTNNNAVVSGGAVFVRGNFTSNGSYYENNSANIDGGATYVNGNGIITSYNNTFINNSATNGGAVYGSVNSTFNDELSEFMDNKAITNDTSNGTGGAIYSHDDVTTNKTVFINNTAHDAGAIASTGNCLLLNNILYNNSAMFNGGAIVNNGLLVLINNNFTSNTAVNQAGAIENYGTLNSTNNIFFNNSATYAGAINIQNNISTNYVHLLNSTFDSNQATIAGAIRLHENNVFITNCIFKNNRAFNDTSCVWIESNGFAGEINITGSNFTNNHVDAIYSISYSENKEVYVAGAINIINNTLNIDSCLFDTNNGHAGGALKIVESNVTVINTIFNNNLAELGGSILLDGTIYINNTNFTNNEAIIDGGAIVSENGYLNTNNSVFINNTAKHIGAISNTGNATLNNTIFINNTATGTTLVTSDIGAGAIYNYGSIDIDYCNFYNNTAINLDGGTVYTRGNDLTHATIKNSNFYGSVGSNGGVIFNNGSALFIDIVFITQGNATTSGGFVYNNKGYLTIDRSYISGNYANNKGGAIFTDGGNLTLNQCSITDNTVEKDTAGAVYITNKGNTTINLCRILDNNATISTDIYVNNSENNNFNDNWWGINNPQSNPTNPLNKTLLYWTTWNNRITLNNSQIIINEWLNTKMETNINSTNNNIQVTLTLLNSTNNQTVEKYERITPKSTYVNGTSITKEETLVNDTTNSTYTWITNINTPSIKKIDLTNVGIVDYQILITDIQASTITVENTTIKTTDTLIIKGNLTLTNNTPLANTNITLTITQGSNTFIIVNITTDANGTFIYTNNTHNLKPGTYNITATFNGSNNNPAIWASNQTATLIVQPDIILNKEVNNTQPLIGEEVTFKLTITNNDKDSFSNINISDKLNSTAYQYISSNADNGQYDPITGIWTINTLNNKTIATLNITVKILASGTLTNTVQTTIQNNTYINSTNIIVPYHYIEIENITSYPGDIINITCILHSNIKLDASNIIFKINGKTIKDANITINNNTITLYNYKINDKWFGNQNYTTTVKYQINTTKEILESNGTLTLLKIPTIIIVDPVTNMPGEYINLTATVTELNNNTTLTNGTVIFKINENTINGTVHFINGKFTLEYKIPANFTSNHYKITAIYGESNKYLSSTNKSLYTLIKQPTIITINTTPITQGQPVTITATFNGSINGINVYSGNTVIKINGKTITPKINITNGTIIYTLPSNITHINSIEVVYSGNNALEPTRTTLKIKSITMKNQTYYKGDKINITSTLNNIGGNITDAKVIFKLNGITLKDTDIIIQGTQIILKDYTINDTWHQNKYTITVKYQQKGTTQVLTTNATLILLNKPTEIQIENIENYHGTQVLIQGNVTLNNSQLITYPGEIILKINENTLKDENNTSIKVNVINGTFKYNYTIPTSFRDNTYRLSLIFQENNYYAQSKNNSTLTILKQNPIVTLEPITASPGDNITLHVKIIENITQEPVIGKIVFKIDGKTITPKITLENGTAQFNYTLPNNIKLGTHTINMTYSGNNVVYDTRTQTTLTIKPVEEII